MKLIAADIGGIHGDASKIAKNEFAIRWANNCMNIVFHCPSQSLMRARLCMIPINHGAPIEQDIPGVPESKRLYWGWDGNEKEPTLTPSISCINRCGWHGHITKGELL